MKNKTITLSPHDVINEVLDKLVPITSAEKEIGSYFRILETNKKEMIAPSCGVSQLHDNIFTSYQKDFFEMSRTDQTRARGHSKKNTKRKLQTEFEETQL
jgi:hypothetical protein